MCRSTGFCLWTVCPIDGGPSTGAPDISVARGFGPPGMGGGSGRPPGVDHESGFLRVVARLILGSSPADRHSELRTRSGRGTLRPLRWVAGGVHFSHTTTGSMDFGEPALASQRRTSAPLRLGGRPLPADRAGEGNSGGVGCPELRRLLGGWGGGRKLRWEARVDGGGAGPFPSQRTVKYRPTQREARATCESSSPSFAARP